MSTRKGYLLNTTEWNGTVPMQSHYCVILDKCAAEEAKLAVDKANLEGGNCLDFTVSTDVEEIEIFETKDDVPILNINND